MKRVDLVRRISSVGYVPLGGGTRGPHQIFVRGTHKVSVPRHREVNEHLARKILRETGA